MEDLPEVELEHPLDRFKWMTDKMKNQLRMLECIRPYKSPALSQHMVDCFEEWQEFFEALD